MQLWWYTKQTHDFCRISQAFKKAQEFSDSLFLFWFRFSIWIFVGLGAGVHLRSWGIQASISALQRLLQPSATWCQLSPSYLPFFSGSFPLFQLATKSTLVLKDQNTPFACLLIKLKGVTFFLLEFQEMREGTTVQEVLRTRGPSLIPSQNSISGNYGPG